MASVEIFQFARWMMDVDMVPFFFGAHFLISSIGVREDSKDMGPRFRQQHPFAMWFCTLMASVSGVFVANFLFGNPLVDILKETRLIIFLTIVWYLMNYSPKDVVYKLALTRPVFLSASVLQECLRVRFIYLGLKQAAAVYPNAPIIILIGGIIKGNGYGFIRVAERFFRGKWDPSSNDILNVTYFCKSGVYASVAFLLHHIGVLQIPIELLYLAVVVIFVIGRMLFIARGMQDPLLPIEMPVYRLLFGSTSKTAMSQNGSVKSKEDKKKD